MKSRVDRSCRPIFDADRLISEWISFVVSNIKKPKPKPKSVFFLRFSVIFGFWKTDVGFGVGLKKNEFSVSVSVTDLGLL